MAQSTVKIIIVTGPTACGKTDLIHQVADSSSDFIINADSRQFYRHLNIGTAKPTPEELFHYHYQMVNFLDPGESISVYDFLNYCLSFTQKIQKFSNNKKSRIFVVGGSLFYLDVIKKGLPTFPKVSQETKFYLLSIWKKKGLNYLISMLKEREPRYYKKIDLKNPRRVLRALEILESGGNFTELRKKRISPPWDFIEITPILPRKVLYQRIEERVDKMLAQGWIEEVRNLLNRFSYEEIKSCYAIGYNEIINHLKGNINYEQTVTIIKQKTRQMAKKQLTWLKKEASGYLILNPKTGYNSIEKSFKISEQRNYEFSNTEDRWMNRYPQLQVFTDYSSKHSLSFINKSNLPTLLVTENKKKVFDEIIRNFYE